MAKLDKKDTKEIALNNSNEISKLQNKKEIVDFLENLEEDAFESASYPMLELEAGEQERCIFIGMQKFQGEQGEIDASIMMCSDGEKRILANAMPVDILSNYNAPLPVIITLMGEKKGKNGKTYKVFDVKVPKGAQTKVE